MSDLKIGDAIRRNKCAIRYKKDSPEDVARFMRDDVPPYTRVAYEQDPRWGSIMRDLRDDELTHEIVTTFTGWSDRKIYDAQKNPVVDSHGNFRYHMDTESTVVALESTTGV